MVKITISLTDEKALRLQVQANKLGVNAEELVRIAAENLLEAGRDRDLHPGDPEFQRAAEYVLKKNAELYKRLA